MTDTPNPAAGSASPWRPGRPHNVIVTSPSPPSPQEPPRPVRRPGARRSVALGLLPLSGLLILVAVVGVVVTTPDGDAPGTDVGAAVGSGLTGLLLTTLAAFVLAHREEETPHHRFGWALAAIGWFWGLTGLAEAWVRLAVVTDEALPGTTLAAWLFYRGGSFLPATVALLALLFPTGRFLPGAWGVAGRVALGVMVLNTALFVLVPDVGSGEIRLPAGADPDVATIGALAPLSDLLIGVIVPVTVAAMLVPLATVVVRHRRSHGRERERMRWLLWGVLVTALVVVLVLLVDLGPAAGPALFLAVNLVPVSMTVAIVNPGLVSIEELLGRTLVYGGLSLLLVAVDLAVLAGLTSLLGDALAEQQVVVLVLLLSVALYGPLRLRLLALVRRVMLGDRDNRYDVVAGLASTLESTDDGPAQLAAVAGTVASAFGVGFVEVEVDRGNGETVVATHGTRPDRTRTLPIVYRESTVGHLVLPASGLRSRLTRRDERLLADVVRQAATATRTGQLAEELQESRERLVVAREEERRRIRRDLHDGLGPSLGGVVFQLESARLLVATDPAAAQDRIAAASRHVQDVVADVRRLVHDLRPPALDDRGLVGALTQLAEQSPVPVEVVAEDLEPLPAAVEVAAYRIAGEALTNAQRHAHASRCTISLRRTTRPTGEELLVEVSDDGVGVPSEVEAGVGLVSLRERAAELGGRSEIVCPPSGGTLVRARLPLRSSHDRVR